MPELVNQLLIRIWRDAMDNRIGVGQVRATKLMYLIEWEYFAWTRKRLTDLDWIFLHYGPWSSKLTEKLRTEFQAPWEAEDNGFRPLYWKPPTFQGAETRLEPGLEGIVERVLETFGALSTGEIVRYVYFSTEPMQHGTRGDPLSFELSKRPIRPFNPVKALSSSAKKDLRERLAAAARARLSERGAEVGSLSGDAAAFLWSIDVQGAFSLPAGEVDIPEEARRHISREG